MTNQTTILIVDDDHGMIDTMSDILSEMDYSVDIAPGGYKGIEMVKTKTYDLVLMDIKMPDINGVETFKEIKRISPVTKVMMMTAYSVDELIKEAMEEGAYGILYKPLDIEKVIDFITNAKKGIYILIVDDDTNLCATLQDILLHKGYIARVAHSGEEAITHTREKYYDIVFIDLKMPTLNGLDTYLAIKKINSNITAVMMTGYYQKVEKLALNAIKNSAYICLCKPLDINEVTNLVENILRQKQNGTLKKPA